jgi:hypothetical protein
MRFAATSEEAEDSAVQQGKRGEDKAIRKGHGKKIGDTAAGDKEAASNASGCEGEGERTRAAQMRVHALHSKKYKREDDIRKKLAADQRAIVDQGNQRCQFLAFI